jgi:NAD(P)H-nitrite reductase large subunit
MVTSAGASEALPSPIPRAMTRCECTGITFEELASRMDADQVGLEEICRRTESGTTCTACLPDLLQFIAARAR